MCIREEYKQLAVELEMLCREFQESVIEVERKEEVAVIREKLGHIRQEVKGKLEITMPELLVALLDAYEVTRDEEMLQEVLEVVSGNMERLEASVEGVKLLAYCYYYVEEEVCAVKARKMLEELKERGWDGEELMEAQRVVEEML